MGMSDFYGPADRAEGIATIHAALEARKRCQLHESLGALEPALRPDELEEIERAVPADRVAGNRYNAAGMSTPDSEGRRTQSS
jgi:pyridoxine 4-dehydrogenase